MPTIDWMTQPYPTGWVATKAAQRTASTARHISDKPVAIELHRNGTPLAAQTVRIEMASVPRIGGQTVNVGQQTYIESCIVFGLPTLDIAVGDRFGWGGNIYSVIGVTPHAGEIQAEAERYQT